MILETIVTTLRPDGSPHIAPMGIHVDDDTLVLAPFRPSGTLENLTRERVAVINYTDDVRIFAGCLTGRYDWPLCRASRVNGYRLQHCLAHTEVNIERIDDDEVRPRLYAHSVFEQTHAPFRGFNRAQAAVIEASILISRLHLLPRDRIEREVEFLAIAVEKTAGTRERTAWDWLLAALQTHWQERDAQS